MKYVFIVNPISGKRDANEVLVPKIHAFFQDRNLEYAVEVTSYPKHALEIAKQYAQTGERVRLCACGGDGTLNEVVTGAFGYDNAEIACYPNGGGNDYIKCFGESEPFRDLETVVSGKSIAVDLLRLNDNFCVNILSVGLDADISEAVNKYRKAKFLRGPMAYNMALLECVLKPLGKPLVIEIGDSVRLEKNFILVVAGNGKVYGGGYMALPEAKNNDGAIDIVFVEKMGLARVAKLIPIYKKGYHIKRGDVIADLNDKMYFYRCTDHMRILSKEPFIVNFDGERIQTTNVEISMLPAAVRFIVPASPEAVQAE